MTSPAEEPQRVRLATIAVDLTPLLPGGDNGGAKPFALELVRRLAALAPATRFVLLTQAASHDELAALDAPNVRRVCVLGEATAAARAGAFRALTPWLARMPAFARRAAGRLAYEANAALKRRGAREALRGIDADLLFCPFTAPAFRQRGVPAVCTLYDLQYRAHPEFFAIEDAVQRDRAFRDACRHAAALAAISDYSRAAAIEAAGLAPERIRTIAIRLPVAAPGGGADATLERLGLARGGYLLYPANFWPHKNHARLFEAFAAACHEIAAPPRLVCTGAPGERQRIAMAAAARAGLGDRVIFPGFVARDVLLALMAASRGVVFPSLYEGFGLPVVEAMALGVPVACSRVAALPEVAGDAALWFDPLSTPDMARAIVALAIEEPLRRRLVEAGRERAHALGDAARMAREYWSLFEAVAR